MTIPTTTAALQAVDVLEHFAAAYGVTLPPEVAEARTAALDLARTARTRPGFDLSSKAREAVATGDPLKDVSKLGKALAADEAERRALAAVTEAAAVAAQAAATRAAGAVVEAALTGPTMQQAASELEGILSSAGDLPAVARPDDYRAVILHARLREVEAVAEGLVTRSQALPGASLSAEFPILTLMDPAAALAGNSFGAVRAATRGISGATDLGAWQTEPGMSAPVHKPVNPTAPAALLLARRGATVALASSIDDLDKRHSLVAESGAVTISGTDQGWFAS